MDDKREREAFEAWFARHAMPLYGAHEYLPMWLAWQASRLLDSPAQGAVAEQPGWRPIESAPRDGRLINVRGGVAHWRNDCWWTLTGEQWPGRPIQWEVTHWYPLLDALPAPPTGEGG
jgi:hypothetical protein